MANVLVQRLEAFGRLSEADKDLVDRVTAVTESHASDSDVVREGDAPNDVNLIVSGFACRFKTLADGRRQIVGYMVPGDFCDVHTFMLDATDYSVATLTDVQLVKMSRKTVAMLLDRPDIARALLLAKLVEKATLREWLANVGQRPAEQRLAHLFCELHLRLKMVGLVKDDGFELPITQTELGDTTGLSTVHVNRSLQSLRAQGLINLRGKRLAIPDVERLQLMSGFRPNYLHLGSSMA